jgi:hypothetical protein
MLLSRGQTAKRADNFLSREFHHVFERHSFDHFGEHGTAGQGRRATVSEESRRFYPALANSQAHPQTIAADWVRLLSYGVSIREFTRVPRIGNMIFECFGVGQWIRGQQFPAPISSWLAHERETRNSKLRLRAVAKASVDFPLPVAKPQARNQRLRRCCLCRS